MKKRMVSLFLAVVFAVALLPMTAFAAPLHPSCTGTDCLVCDIAGKINALAKKNEISLDNAVTVQEQIRAIDRIKMDLTDDQYEELLTLVDQGSNGSGGGLGVPVRYVEAIAALERLTGGGSLYITKRFVSGNGAIMDLSDAKVQVKITNVEENKSELLTMSTLDASANFYSESIDGSGWTYQYILPAGTYRIEELGDSGAMINGSPFVTGARVFNVDGQQSTNSATVTVEKGQQSDVALYNERASYPVKVIFDGVNVGGAELLLKGLKEYKYKDGDSPKTVEGDVYEMIVTAPAGYVSRVTDLRFNADGWNHALIGDGAEQGVSVAYNPNEGENGSYTLTIKLQLAAAPIRITEDVTDQLAMVGGEAMFSVKAEGENLSYQWEVNKGNGWISIPNGCRATLRVGNIPIEADGQQFRCVITDASGNTLTSSAATLHIRENAPIPQTGDGLELFLFAGLAALALVGMIGLRKREQN